MSLNLPPPYQLIWKDSTTSTNDDAVTLAEQGSPSFTLIVAGTQTSARGRFNRPWVAAPGNLYWSVILRRQAHSPSPEGLVFVAGLAIAETVERAIHPARRVELKWPNDVLIDGAKVSGVLIESRPDAGWFVVGIGLNIVAAPLTGETAFPATCLQDAGATDSSLAPVCENLCATFTHWYERWETQGVGGDIREAYLARMWRREKRVAIALDPARTRIVSGINLGIDQKGFLRLDVGAADPVVIAAGDVLFPSYSIGAEDDMP